MQADLQGISTIVTAIAVVLALWSLIRQYFDRRAERKAVRAFCQRVVPRFFEAYKRLKDSLTDVGEVQTSRASGSKADVMTFQAVCEFENETKAIVLGAEQRAHWVFAKLDTSEQESFDRKLPPIRAARDTVEKLRMAYERDLNISSAALAENVVKYVESETLKRLGI